MTTGPLAVDGLNVCSWFREPKGSTSKRQPPNAEGLNMCARALHYEFSVDAVFFMPAYTKDASFRLQNRPILDILVKYNMVKYVECARTTSRKHPWTSADDLEAINAARAWNSFVVTRDKYLDHCRRDRAIDDWIEDHRLPFVRPHFFPDTKEWWKIEFKRSDEFLLDVGRRQNHLSGLYARTRKALEEIDRLVASD